MRVISVDCIIFFSAQVIPVDQQAGILYPFYDEDCKVLYIAGKVCSKIFDNILILLL